MTNRRIATLVFLACAIPRAAMLLVVPRPPANYYWDLSTEILTTHSYSRLGFPTTTIEPLYPTFLAAARWTSGDRFALAMLIQILLAAAAGVLLFHMTVRLTLSRRAALLTSLLYAAYPYYVRQSVAPLEVTLSTCLLIGAAWQFARIENTKAAAACGVWLGLLLLLRAMFAPVWAAAAIVLMARRRWRAAAAVALVPLALVGPWALRSWSVDRAIVPSRLGENLYVSTCEPGAQAAPTYDVDLILPQAYAAVDADRIVAGVSEAAAERALDDALLARALECVRERPFETVRNRLRNLLYVFSPRLLPAHARLPLPKAIVDNGRLTFTGVRARPWFERAAHFAAHLTITVLAVVGMWRRRRRWHEDALLLAMLANTALVYSVFFPTTRLVAPTAFVLMFYAGCAVVGRPKEVLWVQ